MTKKVQRIFHLKLRKTPSDDEHHSMNFDFYRSSYDDSVNGVAASLLSILYENPMCRLKVLIRTSYQNTHEN